jgi:hypothetical protein
MPLTGGEPVIRSEAVKDDLRRDGFRPGTQEFACEMDRRYIRIGTDAFTENDDWDGSRRTPKDYE